MDINKLLEPLWSTIIEQFDVNMKDHSIKLIINSCENKVETSYTVIFDDVAAYSWINGSFEQGKDRYDSEKWNFIDLTSLIYTTNAKISVIANFNENKFFSTPNFMIEIWNSILLIEAGKLTINGITYVLNKN